MSVPEHQVITDKQGIPVTVGERMSLIPAFVDETWGVIKSVKWTIGGKIVKGYDADRQTYVKVKPFPEGEKENLFVDFYWIEKGDGIKVEADCVYSKGRKKVTATFNVHRPKVDSFSATVDSGVVIYGRSMQLGIGRGIVFRWSVSNAGATNGELKDLQLMVDDRRRREDNGRRWVRRVRGASPGEWVLDNSNPYADSRGKTEVWKPCRGTPAPWPLMGRQQHPGIVDTPATDLPPGKVYHPDHPGDDSQAIRIVHSSVWMQFRYYLMYRSEKPQSIWIPIAEAQWHWSGTAQFSKTAGTWDIVERDHSASPPIVKNQFIDLPVWERAGGSEAGLSVWKLG